ncbi:MAG: hypothetical protein ACYTG7_23800 [Planctomycetota bacterium]|jgi:hypothetical protein
MCKRYKALLTICLLGLLMTLDPSHAHSIPVGQEQSKPELSREEQELLNYLYLLKGPELWKAIGLSPVQQVKMEVYDSQLKSLTVCFVSDGRHSDATVAAMNTRQKQLERCTDLGRVVADALTGAQKARFQREIRNRKFQPVEILMEPETITLVFRFGIRGKVTRSTHRGKEKVGKIRCTPSSSSLAKMLPTFSDVSEAILDKDNTVQAVGTRALSTLPMNYVDPRKRAPVARVLLELAGSEETGVIREDDLMKSLVKVVDASHERALLALARDASGTRLSGVVAALSRAAPDEAIALARSHISDFQAFSNALEGFVMHGSEAEPHLNKLNEVTKGKRSILVQSALNRIGKTGTQTASRKASFQARPMPEQSIQVKPSQAKEGSSGCALSLSELLKSLRSDDYWDQANALDSYEKAKHNFLGTLSRAEKSELVNLSSEKLRAEAPSILGDKYGGLLLDVADRGSIRLFEELASSSQKQVRVHGLAGLMKFSQKKAVEAGIRIESTPLGIFTIVEAAKLVGPDSVPTLKELKRKLKEWSSQRWIDDAIKDLK